MVKAYVKGRFVEISPVFSQDAPVKRRSREYIMFTLLCALPSGPTKLMGVLNLNNVMLKRLLTHLTNRCLITVDQLPHGCKMIYLTPLGHQCVERGRLFYDLLGVIP